MCGILLGAVCLISGCGKREAVFVAGENPWEETSLSSEEDKVQTQQSNSSGDGTNAEDTKEEVPVKGQGQEEAPVGGQDQKWVPLEGQEALQELVVYVCGQVQNPGVYTLHYGSRIADAVELAGGMTPEAADVLNLAEVIGDGQMIRVPSLEEVRELEWEYDFSDFGSKAASGQAGAGNETKGKDTGSASEGRVSLNGATREQLLTLPGIGESKADAILRYRQEHGAFQSVEEIMNISGIKEGVFLKIKDKITI